MSKKVFDVVASAGEYTSGGETKTRWINCGAVFKSDKGNYSMKLESVPTKRNEQGELWLSLFVPRERDQDKPQQQQGFREPAAQQSAPPDDEFPF